MIPDRLLFFLPSATRSHTEKFLISEKENVPARRDTEMLILAKDSGKHFTSGSSVHIGGGESESDDCPLLDKHSHLWRRLRTTHPVSQPGNCWHPNTSILLMGLKSGHIFVHS